MAIKTTVCQTECGGGAWAGPRGPSSEERPLHFLSCNSCRCWQAEDWWGLTEASTARSLASCTSVPGKPSRPFGSALSSHSLVLAVSSCLTQATVDLKIKTGHIYLPLETLHETSNLFQGVRGLAGKECRLAKVVTGPKGKTHMHRTHSALYIK